MSGISINNLNVWFGEGINRVDAVKNASFQVDAGDSFGLVGESGSGKSTILRALTGLAENWSGQMEAAGEVLGKTRSPAFYKKVQMVFQDPYASLHPRHSVDQVLSETLFLHGFDEIDTRIVQLLEDVGLGTSFRFRYPHQSPAPLRQNLKFYYWMNQHRHWMFQCKRRFSICLLICAQNTS